MGRTLTGAVRPSPPIVVTATDHRRLSRLAAAAREHMPAVGELLFHELGRAQVVDATEISPAVVTMNSQVEFRDHGRGRRRTVTLVYPGQADLADGRLSILTPIGAALIGLAEGQYFEWLSRNGAPKSLSLLKVHYQPEAQGLFDVI